MPGRRGDRLGWLRGEIAENVHDSSPVPLGAFTRFTLVTRAFGPGSEAGLGLSVEAGGVSRTAPHGSWPFEVERMALRLGPASPHSVPAESGHSSPLWARPDPLAALQDTRSTADLNECTLQDTGEVSNFIADWGS
jgi:hypothetical protein